MYSFSPNYLKNTSYSSKVLKLLGDCMEAKGREKSYLLKNPELLKELENISMREETIASNAIENVFSSADIFALSERKIVPTSKSEFFLRNYYNTLLKIKNNPDLQVNSDTIKMLHHFLFEDIEEGGKFKNKEVFITEKGTKIRFKSVSPDLTPKYIKNLCISYEEYIKDIKTPQLIVISSFIFDFLCIHPFIDGNGRVSRLLTNLLLMQNGYEALSYISLDKIINRYSDHYYHALYESSKGWHKQKHDMDSWHVFFLSVIREAYTEIFSKIEQSDGRSSKTEIIKNVVSSKKGDFTLAELQRELPSISNAMIRKVLTQLKEQYKVATRGKGRGAHWKVIL
ncbi:MAG: Fic family protein [Deltaproteobacteria bacterium]|nr:MAG: Fic family protein [Deltaproteobacteria bacterium]